MNTAEHIVNLFEKSIELKRKSIVLAPVIAVAAARLTASLVRGNKILICGNGGSAADAQHMAAELVNRFESERPGLAAIALTTDSSALTSIGNDSGFEQVFARQVEAIGRTGDVLVAITTSGESANLRAAVATARDRGIAVVALTGRDGGAIGRLCGAEDCEIRVPGHNTARIQEVHLLVVHALCASIDAAFAADPRTT